MLELETEDKDDLTIEIPYYPLNLGFWLVKPPLHALDTIRRMFASKKPQVSNPNLS